MVTLELERRPPAFRRCISGRSVTSVQLPFDLGNSCKANRKAYQNWECVHGTGHLSVAHLMLSCRWSAYVKLYLTDTMLELLYLSGLRWKDGLRTS